MTGRPLWERETRTPLLQAFFLLAAIAACSDATTRSTGERPPPPPAHGVASPPLPWPPAAVAFFAEQRPDPRARHVHLMHLDGFHAALFERLLAEGTLPHFAFLLARGRLSTTASTVDKSETFKVIQAYLTSRLETRVTGWWQFERDELSFRNFWLDPVDVAAYALGLEFPLHPTVFDVVAASGGNVAAGFSLHRRSVPFQNYSRNYLEGARAVFKHTYPAQAHATMSSFLTILERIARSHTEALPVFSMSLIAVADEFGHLDGIVRPHQGASDDPATACFGRTPRSERDDDPLEIVFRMLDEDYARGGWIRRLYERGLSRDEIAAGRATAWFSRVERGDEEARRFCIHVPAFETAAWPVADPSTVPGETTREHAAPRFVLGMILADIELGRLIDALRAIRWRDGRRVFEPASPAGIDRYVAAGRPENSLFERTLFLLLGDHGMVHTPLKMAPEPAHPGPLRHPDSLDAGLLEHLNARLGLVTPARHETIAGRVAIGIDDAHLPVQLSLPHRDTSWQSAEVRRLVRHSERWAEEFFAEIKHVLRSELYARYWWLLYLRSLLVDPKLETTLEPYRESALPILTELHLRGVPDYVRARRLAGRRFYDEHVRLVYGGGARNNAELFLPTWRSGRPSWESRPGFEEIVNGAGARVLRELERLPAVGLIFVREENAALEPGRPLPSRMAIRVQDRAGRSGRITVKRDHETGVLLYHYRVDPASPGDPLGYGEPARGGGTWGTYEEWNDRSLEEEHAYHNAVAGMGSYLYSPNPSIGDITIVHAQGWNFGDNSGGHGGLHREEKLSVLMVSGPGIAPGKLMAVARHASQGDRAVPTRWLTHPTVLDAAPTALAWLGFGETALTDFARRGFPEYLSVWVAAQQEDILGNLDNVENLNQALREAGFSELRISRFRERLARLLEFLPRQPPPLPDAAAARVDGNLLALE